MRLIANIIINDKEEILLLKRSPERKSFPDTWCFLSGTIEEDEVALACSSREMPEELGDEFVTELIEVGEPFQDLISGGDFFVYPFLYRYISGEIQLDREHSECRWIPLEDIEKYKIVPGLLEDIKHLKYFRKT